MASDALAVVSLYQRQMEDVRQRLLRFVDLSWRRLDSYRDDDIDRWVTQVTPVLDGAQIRTADLMATYLAAYEKALFGKAKMVGVSPRAVSTEAMRGITTPELLERAGVQVWTALSKGQPIDAAALQGLDRARSLTETGVELAKTHTARDILKAKPGVVGYRRVLRGGKTCALCAVASTQRYLKADLQPIHPGCHCGVQPIYGTKDPGQVIDPDTLESTHAQIAERFGGSATDARAIDYRKELVVHEHGEIGPVLAIRGQTFTGPSGIAA